MPKYTYFQNFVGLVDNSILGVGAFSFSLLLYLIIWKNATESAPHLQYKAIGHQVSMFNVSNNSLSPVLGVIWWSFHNKQQHYTLAFKS